MNASCQTTWEGSCLVASLSGEVDHHQAAALRDQLDEEISRKSAVKRPIHLIFSFEKVTFMDSSGIGVIMGRYNKIRETGGTVFITGCGDYVDRILEMSGIYTIARREESVAHALYQCGKAGQIYEQ